MRKRDYLPPLETVEMPSTPSQEYSKRLRVLYTNQLLEAEEWAKFIQEEQKASGKPLMLGWDMESSPRLPWREQSYDEDTYFGPATLQLSTTTEAVMLQLAQDKFGPFHEGGLPRFLHDLLNNPGVIPVGVGIDDDFVELYRFCLEYGDDCDGPAWATGVMPRFDMGGIGIDPAKKRGGATNGLKKLTGSILGVVLPKSKRLATTHWSKDRLSKVQVAYAARDAWAGAAICERMAELDPDRFDPSVIQQQLQDQMSDGAENPLRSIREISNRQLRRKPIKDEWKELDRTKKKSKSQEEDAPEWTDEQEERYDELREKMRSLAPSKPICFETEESLGLEVSY